MKPPLYRWQGSLFWWVEVFCMRAVRQALSFLLTLGVLTHFTSPSFCLALPTMTQFHEWSHSLWGSLSASINRHWCCSLCLLHMFFLRSAAASHFLRSSPVFCDAPVDIHGWSHNFPFIHPREALLVGHWVTTLPLFSCGIHFISPPTEVFLHGVGLVHLSHAWWLPLHKGMPTCDVMRRSQFQWRTWLSVLVHHFIRGDICWDLMHHLPSILFPPILDLPLSLKSICLHYYMVTRLQVHCTYLSVVTPFLLAFFHHWLGLHLP